MSTIAVRQNVVACAWRPASLVGPDDALPAAAALRRLGGARILPLWSLARGAANEPVELVALASASNLLPDAGLNYFRDLAGGGTARIDEIAVGTGTTAAAAADVALQTEVFRGAITRRVQESKKINFQLLILQGEANGNTLAEVGLFRRTVLVARAILSPTIVKTSAIMVTIAHELTFSNG